MNHNELLFNERVSKSKKSKIADDLDSSGAPCINEYRGLDVSEYPNFNKNMKKHHKRMFALFEDMMHPDKEKHSNKDERRDITIKFVDLAYEILEHFDNLEDIQTVNKRFEMVSHIMPPALNLA